VEHAEEYMLYAEGSQPLNAAYKTQVIDLGYDVAKVVSSLTSDRLTKYYQRVGSEEHGAALRLYCWNHEVGAAFTVLLQQFEVCLRNHISAAVRDKFGADWFRANKLVGYNPEIRDLIGKAHAKARENRNGFDPAERDIISASSMGMWRELCKPACFGVNVFICHSPTLPLKEKSEKHLRQSTAKCNVWLNFEIELLTTSMSSVL
jgi:hypothetical protein